MGREFKRKVRTLAGVYQVAWLLPRLLVPTRAISFHFWSHKLGRLIVPFAMVAFFASSLMTPPPMRGLLVGAQALAVGGAALDLAIPEGSLVKRISSPARSFFLLQLSALVSASVLFRSPRSFWR